MVEELKLAIKVDDDSIEQSLLKQFANAQKMADKVVLDFKNVNFDDKEIEAKFKALQKKAGQNPIDLSVSKDTIQMLSQISDKLGDIFKITQGKSIIDSSSTIKEIDKINKSLNKTSEILNKSFSTKNKTEAFNQLKEASVAYEKFYGNEKAMATQEGTQAAYNYYKAYEEALKKGVAQTRLEKVTIDVEKGYNFNSSDLSSRRIKEFENYQKYGGDLSDLSLEIASLDGKLKDFSSAYAEVKKNLGEAPITPEIISNIEHYVELLDNVRYLKSWNKSDDKDIIAQDESSAKYFLDSAIYKAQEQNYNYTDSLKTQEIQAIATAEAEKKLAETQKEVSSTASQNPKKDAFPKTSENLEQVVQSEQKVQQEAVETDKALDNISFTPNTEGFEDIIAKFGILREQAEQITKIVKTTKQTADGTPDISYKATLRNGSSYYLGENSTPQVLNASETVYDAKADNAKKLEREKQIWNELTTSLDRYATLQKRIASNNALSTDNEEATKLLEHIHELQRNDILPAEKLTVSNEKLQQINQTVTDLKAKLKESTLDSLQGSIDKYQKIYDQRSTYSSDFAPSEQYTKNLIGLNTAIENLVEYRNALKNVGEVTVEQEAYLKGLVTACEKASDSFKSLSASEKGTSQIGIDKLVQRINKDLDECTNYSKEAKLGLRALRDELESANPRNLKEITSEIINIENAEIRAGRAGKSFFDIFKTKGIYSFIGQMQSYLSMYVGFYGMVNAVKSVVSTVTELNSKITELAKVSEQSSSQIYADFDSYADIAKEVRGTISDTIAATANWSKNGYNIPDAKQLAEVSQLYKNVGDGIDINTANESLISTLKGFQLEADQAEHIVDVFNEVSNNEAISSGGIGEALQRSAASFNAASTSLEKSVSLVTATNSVLQNPEKVGNMWRTVSARLRGSETELKEMGEDTDGLVTSTSKLQALVKGITGFDIMKDKDTYKDIYDIVLGIGEKWKDLSDIDRASLLEALAGKQQSNALAAALSNIDILKKSYEEATHAEGSAREENEEYSKSIRASIDLAQAKLEQLANDTLNSNFLKGAIDAGGKLIEVLDGIVKSGNAIPAVATAIAAALSFKNVGIDTLVAY